MLIDNAIGQVRKVMPESGKQMIINSIMQGQKKCFEVGLTSVHDAGLGYETIELKPDRFIAPHR